MVRMDKATAARLGFGGANADRHTADRIYKKVQTNIRKMTGATKPKQPAERHCGEVLPLIKVGECRYIVELEGAYDID